MKNKYRIVENCGKFDIEIYVCEEKGFLWWKKKVCKWYPTNYMGGKCRRLYPVIQPFSKTFKSFKKAKRQIKIWNSDPIYHYK